MYKIGLVLTYLLAAQSVQAAADLCLDTGVNIPQQMSQFKDIEEASQVSCAVLEAQGRKMGVVDPNALRKTITARLENSMTPRMIEQAQKNWNTSQFQNFYMYSRYDQQQKLPPTPLLKWYSDPSFADVGSTDEELKKKFVDKYIAYAEKYDCDVKFYGGENTVVEHPLIKPLMVHKNREIAQRELEDYKKQLSSPENVKAADEYIKKVNSFNREDEMMVCRNKPSNFAPKQKAALMYPPCAGNFQKQMENNQFDLKGEELSKLMSSSSATELASCIKDRVSKGAKIHHISVSASSTALNNTGEAAKLFGAKGFEKLSEARAKTAKEKILPLLFDKADLSIDQYSDKVKVDYKGGNGDGTSGPCPYELVASNSDKEKRKKEFQTKAGEEELESYKYVKIQVTFNEKVDPAKSGSFYNVVYACNKITFRCN